MKNTKQEQSGFGAVELFLILAMIVIVGLLGFIFYSNMQKQNTNAGKQPSTPTETKTVDPHADWKTYTSEKEGLVISYPDSWTYKNTMTANQPNAFDAFTLTGPDGFVIGYGVATVPHGSSAPARKVEFIDQIKNVNYVKPLYVVGSYDSEYGTQDTISVTDQSLKLGQSMPGPVGNFRSKITEKKFENGANIVFLEGKFPLYKTKEGLDASPAHKDFNEGDLKTAREILNTVHYK